MKYSGLIILIVLLANYSCKSQNSGTDKSDKQGQVLGKTELSRNKEEIQNLVRNVLIWSDSKESIDLLPVIEDSKDSAYIGFDMSKLQANLNKLRATDFFASEFIENYNKIIRTIDKKMRNKEIETWLVGDLRTFNFANDISPWCQCQGYSQDDIDNVEVIKIDNKCGELKWKWKKGSSWNDFLFRVLREDNRWKVSYMEGFDFNVSTK